MLSIVCIGCLVIAILLAVAGQTVLSPIYAIGGAIALPIIAMILARWIAYWGFFIIVIAIVVEVGVVVYMFLNQINRF